MILPVLLSACASPTPTPQSRPVLTREVASPTLAGQIETQVAATIAARDAATAAVEQAVKLTLTASAPKATVPSTPTATQPPVALPTAVPPTATKPAAANADVISGKWAGTISGANNFTTRLELNIQKGCAVGSICGTYSAPQLPCAGNLLFTAVNGDVFTFVEQFTTGGSSCTSGANETIRLLPNGTLDWKTVGQFTSTAILTRQ